MIKIDTIESIDDFAHLEPIWNDLVFAVDPKQLFLTHEWLRCWWKGYGNGKKLHILLFRDREKVIGIAPLMLSVQKKGGVRVKTLGLIENDEVAYTDFIFPQRKDELFAALMDELAKTSRLWDLLEFKRISEQSTTSEALPRAFNDKKIPYRMMEMKRSPFLCIESNWDCFYASRSRRFKKRINHNVNKSRRMGETTVCRYQSPEEIRKVFAEVVTVSKNSWKGRIGKDIAGNKDRYAFFKELTEKGAARGWVTIWVLRLNDQAIAMEYHVGKDGKIFALRGDFDERYGCHSPGAMLEYHIIRNHFDNDHACEYDLCGSDDAYKMCWTDAVRNQYVFQAYNPFRFYSRLLLKAAKFRHREDRETTWQP